MGISLETTSLRMLNVGFVQHNGDWNWKNVHSPFTRIYYVTEGKAAVYMGRKCVQLTPNHLYMIPANVKHSYECNGLFCHYYLHMFETHNSGSNFMDFYEFPPEVEGTQIDRELFAEICEHHPEARLPESNPQSYNNQATFMSYMQRCTEMSICDKVMIEGFIGVLFSRFLQHAKVRPWTSDARITQVLKYINQHLNKDINTEELAGVACLTKPYLIRLFKRNFNTTPLQYINKKKMEKAQVLLITEDMSVKELAYTLGYNDHSYFCRLFKKLTGNTPQEYRLVARK